MARERPWHKSARTSRKKLKKKGRHRQRKGQGGRTGRDGAKEDFTVLQYGYRVEFSKVSELGRRGVAKKIRYTVLFFLFLVRVGYWVLCDYCKCKCCCVDGVCVCKCRAPRAVVEKVEMWDVGKRNFGCY